MRGQSNETASAGLEFRTEATHKVQVGRACWCLCKTYKRIFLVSEDSGAADVGAPCAQPDPEVLGFISAAEFNQGLKRTNEMMEIFKNRSQPLWMQLMMLGFLRIDDVDNPRFVVGQFCGDKRVPHLGDRHRLGRGNRLMCTVRLPLIRSKKKHFEENVETELKEVWKNAVAQGVGVAFENEHTGSGESNTYYPAAVTITLPYGARGAVSAI